MRPYENSRTGVDQASTSKPPKLEDVLIAYVSSRKDKIISETSDTREGFVKLWIAYQEPPSKYDEPKPVYKDDQIISWQTPYIDRIEFWLRKFLSFDYQDQKLIMQNMKVGIAWRGDDMWFYLELCETVKRLQENPEKYADLQWPDILHSLVKGLSSASEVCG